MRHFRTILTLLSVLGLLMWLLLGNFLPDINANYVVFQSRQNTCGPASVATLLNYYLACPTSEQEIMSSVATHPATMLRCLICSARSRRNIVRQ